MTARPRQRRTSVATIVTLAVVAATTVLVLSAGTFAYRSYRAAQWATLERMHRALADQLSVGLALPVWNFDREEIDRIIDSAMEIEEVAAVVVRLEDTGATVHGRGRDDQWRVRRVTAAPSGPDLLAASRAISTDGDRLGTLTIVVTPRFAEARLRRSLIVMIGFALLLDGLLVVSLLLLFWRFVLAPLREAERFAVAVTLGEAPRPELAERRFHGELETLRASLEATVALLEARYDALETKEGEVRQLNETLERRVAERTAELQESERRLAAASRTKSEFVANISHEIRTPVNAVIGLTHLVLQTQLSEKQREYLTRIRASTEMLLAVINQVLDFSKIEAGKLDLEDVAFRLEDVLRTTASMLTARAEEKGIALEVRLAPDVPAQLRGDPLRLGQVLLNLAGNGVKFTERGSVTLSVEVVELHAGAATLRFSVRDTGIGMSEAERDRLFVAFAQADGSTTRRYGGTGLGLVISRRVVEQMGGTLVVESAPGRGSTFTFVLQLPIASALAAAPEAAGPPRAGARPLGGVRLLVVEDNEINQQVAQALLEDAGATVEIAANGLDAARAVTDHGERFDVVIMDVQMPGMDGYEASRTIRRDPKGAAIPIIAMTAHAFETERERCLAAGMNDYIPKPMDPERLVAVVQRWRAGAPR